MKKEINIVVKIEDIVGISELSKTEQGIDISINNHPNEDLSIETKQWASVEEFIKFIGEE